MQLNFRIEIFKEGRQFVAIAPELNVSSFADTPEESKTALREAVELFLEECKRMGTLDEVLSEAGFKVENKLWRGNNPVISERMALGI